ncbi:Glycine-rich cell wall structural protein precursor [Salinisphaera sp. LB1]|nr:Glycine-rich cell wall structural protein precursor [Salinisphaera sp. LB1]
MAGGSSAALADNNTFNEVLGGGLGGAIGAAVGGAMGGQTGAVIGGGLGGAGGAILAGQHDGHADDHYRGRDWGRRRDVHYDRRGYYGHDRRHDYDDHDHGRHRGWDDRDWRH